ncbi:gamma-parvin isoform X1 [Phoca vitulina]|uniref:gamma-parvin isoform X1 n=1 Tax=Phoca vitulina TaxID=9720 RepID=UPI0013964D42|nr:gamma-parvin isoform X1 [Phoca vitulina]
MESESLYNLLQLPKVTGPPAEEELPQGEKKKYLPPTSRQDPKFEELQKVLMEWINAKLLPEHIVVRSLEEDIFDGLILHHLFQMLTGLKLEVEEMALTAPSQRRKLEVVLEAINHSLQVEERQLKWSVGTIFSKDLLATLHLLVALAKHFQPDLPLPTNVQVEVITMESTKNGLKSEKSVEQLTQCSTDKDQPAKDIFDELFRLAPEKVNTVKEAIVNFVNQNLDRLGLSVQNLDTQVGTQPWGPQAGKGHGVQVGKRVLRGPGSRVPPPCGPGCVASQSRGVLLSSGGLLLGRSLTNQGHCGDLARQGPWVPPCGWSPPRVTAFAHGVTCPTLS